MGTSFLFVGHKQQIAFQIPYEPSLLPITTAIGERTPRKRKSFHPSKKNIGDLLIAPILEQDFNFGILELY
jgi:hypothetical protein